MSRAALWAPAVAQMAAIFALSSIPNLTRLPGDLPDHVGHAVGYAVLALALLRAYAGGAWAGITAGAAMRAWTAAVFYGASDELHQRFVPGRASTLDDLAADAVGAGLALVVIVVGAFGSRDQGRAV